MTKEETPARNDNLLAHDHVAQHTRGTGAPGLVVERTGVSRESGTSVPAGIRVVSRLHRFGNGTFAIPAHCRRSSGTMRRDGCQDRNVRHRRLVRSRLIKHTRRIRLLVSARCPKVASRRGGEVDSLTIALPAPCAGSTPGLKRDAWLTVSRSPYCGIQSSEAIQRWQARRLSLPTTCRADNSRLSQSPPSHLRREIPTNSTSWCRTHELTMRNGASWRREGLSAGSVQTRILLQR